MTQSNQFDPQAWVFGNSPSATQTQLNREQSAFDPQAWVFQNNADKDVTGFGEKQAQSFSEQLAKFPNATPVQQYQAFEKYGNQLKEHLSTQGYTEEQINKAFSEFSTKADPRNQTSDFEYYIGDRGNNVMVGTGNLASSALAAAPESIPVLGQWADDAEKYTRDVTKAWEKDISAKAQINEYLGNRAEQEALKNGASEFEALLANLKENPMQIVKLLTEQAPQLVLGAAGKVALGVTNVLGGAGRVRNDIEEAYETTAKENPSQLLQLPEIQTRLAQGMSFEEAVNDAKTDITDNWKSILAGAAIGGTEAFTPAGKVFQGLNRGVVGTFAKEVGQEAFQEGAEQLNSNLAVGQIDGKTEAFDNVVRNATLGAIAGAGMGVPTAVDAYFNKDKGNDDENILREVENSATAGAEANRKAQEINQAQETSQSQKTNTVDGVNQKALEAVLSSVQDEQERNDYHDELKKDIKDGLLEQRIAEGGTYGKLAQAYLDATNPTNEQAKTFEEGKDYIKVSTDTIDMAKVRDITDQNIYTTSQADIEKRARAELTPSEYREAVKILKTRNADHYDDEGNLKAEYQYRSETQKSADQNETTETPPQQAVTSSENIATQEVEQETPTDNTLNSNAKQSAPYQSKISAEDSPRFRAYLSDMQTITSLSGEEQAQKSREVQQKYGKDIELFNQEIANQFIANNPALAQELVGRVVDSETQAKASIESEINKTDNQGVISTDELSTLEQVKRRATEQNEIYYSRPKTSLSNEQIIDIASRRLKQFGQSARENKYLPSQPIDLGNTPQALVDLGVPQLPMVIDPKKIPQIVKNEDKNRDHNIDPDLLAQVPMALQNPLAIYNSATEKDAFVVVTELKDSEDRPVIAAVHVNKKQGYNLVNKVASVYGKDNAEIKFQEWKNNGLLRWEKNKSQSVLTSAGLQSPMEKSKIGSSGVNLNNSQQTVNNQIHQDQQTLSRILGEETASHIQVVDSNTQIPSGQDVKKLVANGVEGWFEPKTQKLYIISENIIGNDVLSRDERLAWVAWHELAHAGVRIKYGAMLKNLLESADKHPVVNVITRRTQAEYAKDGIEISKEAAIEEAIVELYSAYQTGNWSELESRYQAKIHKSWKDGKDNVGDFLARIGNLIRRLMGVVIGRDVTQTMTTSQLFDTLRGIEQGINNIAKNSQNPTANTSTNEEARYSLNESSDSDFAKAVDAVANGERTATTEIVLGTTPDVLKMLGVDEANVIMHARTLQKDMIGKHSVSAEAMKQLPKQMNDPVAVMRSRGSSTNPDAYLVLTELKEVENGKELPIIAALSFEKNANGDLELINVASAYGRKNVKVAKDLEAGTLYWHKEKGNQFLDNFSLSAESDFNLPALRSSLSDNDYLSEHNIKTEADLSQYQDESLDNDIRYSRIKPTVLDQIQSGKIHRKEEEETLLDMVKERDFGRFWETLKAKTDRAWADEQRPVIDWLANLEKDGLISHAERVDIVNKMEAAEGVKNAKNAQMMQKYLKPLMQNIAKVAKKHNITTDQAKFWIEHYLSARWAIEKNQQYLDNEFKAMQEAETALLDAQNNGDQKQIDEASRAYRKAERQYRYRKADVESTVYGRDNDGNLLYTPKVGTAGGWSTPHAQAIMNAIEQKGLTVSEIEQAAKPMFEAIQENLLINLAANRITPEQFREFKKTPNYVPLTGDNEIDLDKDNDYIGGAGRRATNVSKDKAAKGRTQSEAEGAFDATWRMLDKTITNAAWQPFKNSIDELYETAKSEAIAQGASDKEATELAEEKTGIQKNVMKGTTRTNDDVFIRKFNNVYYEYRLPTSVMAALNGSQTSSPLNDLWGFRHAKTLTGWFARGVTQFKPMFALKNMVRDGWEKSILITTREILDNNGNDLSQKAKNQIGKEMSKLLWGANLGLNGLYKATAKFAKEGGTANLDNRKDAQGNYINKEQGYLKELIDAGGLSTYSTMLARTRKDLDAEFKRTANPKVYDGAMQLVEIWNTTFDTASSLAAYMALRENGISAERAMGVTLGLMNFRKAGAYAKHFKGFFAFMNPAIQGGKNNLQLIRTRRGQVYLASRVAMGMLVYQLLSLMTDDDDEAGKRMDSKGDITREIIIPTPAGDIRIPVGYGAPQMAWNLSVNAMRWFNGQIPLSDAIANVVSHNVKSVVPVSPNETSAAKDPSAKVINTLAPTILKPFVELATDRNAFGNKITPSYVNEKELHATQSKSNTAQFWEDVATTMYDTFGMDAHPESYQHLFNAYRGFAGSVGDFISATIENPNRLKQGKELSIPVINDFFTIGGKGENRISILYYEGKGEMEALKKAYDYQQEHHPKTLSEWLKEGNRQQLLELNKLANEKMGDVRKIKANATKDLNAKKISQEVYDKRITLYNKRVDEEQRRILYKYRTLEGLNTTKTQ